ncbi:putative transcriptional regulator, Crp/Fnr family [Pseudodesulfovibrio mercurii]|uniref:Putative transcriptional regulator, Crp/Fnr family n=1 Tax=Pseudodesulfovibrio mercurii TaxID=641491 RepID=F0JGS2_9BACT|nr:cyclic nucleotide-binding domain-containing protein [Pseudodesulfovibrio mercurii]EGB15112.1 putative transcriptional regulator, Crp/Fnr family [Pseudodesulfovibrio mercurii]
MNTPDIDWAAITLFADITGPALDKVKPIFEVRTLDAGEDLIREGEEGDEMFILIEGRVRITKSMLLEGMHLPLLEMDSPRKVLATLDQSEYPLFGEIALMDRETRSATVRTLVPSRFLVTDRLRFFDFLEREPALGVRLFKRLARRMAATIRRTNGEVVKLSTALALALSRYKTLG